jgi:hypothetical protein
MRNSAMILGWLKIILCQMVCDDYKLPELVMKKRIIENI